jgi:hypothetical protein
MCPHQLPVRGVSYFVDRSSAAVDDVMTALRTELHATAVMAIGSNPEALLSACAVALQHGLEVYVRPSLDNAHEQALLEHLTRVARGAEGLRRRHPGRVTLLVGSEFSLTSRAVLPGRHTFVRLQLIIRAHKLIRGLVRRRLAPLLHHAHAAAQAEFHGPITYAAGAWEDVDWSTFDVVGVNLYRLDRNASHYAQQLRDRVQDAHAMDKPFVVTEFGCGAFTGADKWGPGSFRIVNWFANPPHIRGDHPRNEQTQANYLTELIDLYRHANADGCFVFTFAMPDFPHSADPRHDLDRAGFGIVAVPEKHSDPWLPKRAFHAVARSFAT